jgi:predicted nucleic acid-binding protein
VSDLIVFDTSVLADDLRTARYQDPAKIQSISGLIRTSSVVLAELWRGATKAAEREFVRALGRNHPIFTPSESIWLEVRTVTGKDARRPGLHL